MPKKKLSALAAAIAVGARQAFDAMRAAAPNDQFYFFALYTDADGASVCATGATEESLVDTVSASMKRRKRDRTTATRDLRFAAVDARFYDFGSDALHAIEGRGLHEACFGALASLDADGYFAEGAARDRVIVNVVYGDMSHERWLAHARRLNPEASIAAALPFLRLNLPSGEVVEWGTGVYQANALSVSRDRSRIAYSGSGGEVGVFDTKKRAALLQKRSRAEHWASVLSSDGARLFLGHTDGARVLDVKTGKARELWTGGKVSSLSRSPDDTRLAEVSWDAPAAIRDASTGAILWTAEHDTETLRFSPDGAVVAQLGAKTTKAFVALLDAGTGTATWSVSLGETRVVDVVFAPDGETLNVATAKYGGPSILRVMHRARGDVQRELAFEGEIDALCVSPSGETLGLCVKRTLLALERDGRELARGTGAHESLHACAFIGENELVAVGRNVNTGPVFLALTW